MQVRRFEELVQTGYIVQNAVKYLAIGSAYVHNIITIDTETLEIKTPTCIGNSEELAKIIETIKNLPDDVLKEILTADDVIENPLPVFMWRDNQIQETQTEDYEWPNTDNKGFILYENTTFKTEKECVEFARSEIIYFLEGVENWAAENVREAQKVLDWIKEYRKHDKYLSEIEAKYKEAQQ